MKMEKCQHFAGRPCTDGGFSMTIFEERPGKTVQKRKNLAGGSSWVHLRVDFG